MNVSYNPIQYQLQLFGVNGAQVGTSLNATNSDPFSMAISAVGATAVPEVQNADGSGSSAGNGSSYRDWVRSTRDYSAAADAGSSSQAESNATSGEETGTSAAGQTPGDAASEAGAEASGAATGNAPGETGQSATGTSGSGNSGSSGTGSTSSGSTSSGSSGGGLFAWLRG